MSLNMRRLQIVKDVLFAEAGAAAPKPITRAVALAVIANPFAGRHVQDLSPLFDIGAQVAEQVMPQLVAALPGSYPSQWLSLFRSNSVTTKTSEWPQVLQLNS